jgi:hypothetical protein
VNGPSTKPRWMRASAQVDLAQLRLSVRPVMRSQAEGRYDRREVRRWARRAGFFAVIDKDGFFSLARSGSLAARALRIDGAPGRHTIALGRALGYPLCCCRAAARCGEEGLDDWAKAISSRRFVGLFRLIEPSGYVAGRANISHVPCSPRCVASLKMARSLESMGTRARRIGSALDRRPSFGAGRPARI